MMKTKFCKVCDKKLSKYEIGKCTICKNNIKSNFIIVQCSVCDKEFLTHPMIEFKKYKYCSKECLKKSLMIKIPDLKDNIQFRGVGWKVIRQDILRRDGFVCRNPKCTSVDELDVHHIKRYIISKDNSPKNLITLCGKCHKSVENSYTKFKTTPKWLRDYIKSKYP